MTIIHTTPGRAWHGPCPPSTDALLICGVVAWPLSSS
jgi:hypothetical protein